MNVAFGFSQIRTWLGMQKQPDVLRSVGLKRASYSNSGGPITLLAIIAASATPKNFDRSSLPDLSCDEQVVFHLYIIAIPKIPSF